MGPEWKRRLKESVRKEKNQHNGFIEAGSGVFEGEWSVGGCCKEVT